MHQLVTCRKCKQEKEVSNPALLRKLADNPNAFFVCGECNAAEAQKRLMRL